jgi:GTP-binding protein
MSSNYTKVAIVGRPNVGKSTLFNRLVRERRAIVDDMPGVTRDRIYADIEWNGKPITLIDTGGLLEGPDSLADSFSPEIRKQVYYAIEDADSIIFLVDGIAGITSQDAKIASSLRKIKNKRKIFLAVNKIDTEKQYDLVHEFHLLGLGEPYPVSALSGSKGMADILDEISKGIKNSSSTSFDGIKIAIVGKPNVGKSSILNCITGEERSIVTPIPGTTRDTIDTIIKVDGQKYLLIDTAGLRRKSKVSSVIERYATARTISAIERSEIVLLLIDATNLVSDQDQKIANLIKDRYKASIVLVNKWDLIPEKKSNTMNYYEESIISDLRFVGYSKVLFTSATEKKNVHKIWGLVREVYSNYQKRVSTGKLNQALEEILLLVSPPRKKGKHLKIYYVTQAGVKPPEIVFFVNDSSLVSEQYTRYLEKEIRKRFDFSGSPLKMVFRNKKKA